LLSKLILSILSFNLFFQTGSRKGEDLKFWKEDGTHGHVLNAKELRPSHKEDDSPRKMSKPGKRQYVSNFGETCGHQGYG